MIKVDDRNAVLSDDPADPRRSPISGLVGEKYATEDSSIVCHQAKEAVNATEDNKRPAMRSKHRIGTWNVRGLLKPGKLEIVEREMTEHQLTVLGLCETHMQGKGHFTTQCGNTMFFSGHDTESINGVGLVIPRKICNFVTGYNTVSDRIMTIRINCTPLPLNIVQVYAPTSLSSQEDIDVFYDALQTTLDGISKREITIIQGDWNAKVGNTELDDHIRQTVGKYGLGARNERGEMFLDFCLNNNLTITNTYFKHHKRRLYTWKSPGDRYRNQIDYITVANRWKSSITNARTFPGADCGSDHQLLVADLQVRLKSCRQRVKVANRLIPQEHDYFQKKTEPQLQKLLAEITDLDPGEQWRHLKSEVLSTLDSMVKKPEQKKDWMSDEVWSNIRTRKELKNGIRTDNFEEEYTRLSGEIQRQCRRDKNQHLENICIEIERHAEKYQTADLFKKVKQITHKFKPSSWVIDDKNGKPIHEVAEVAERWREYCEELYQAQPAQTTAPAEVVSEKEPDILRSEVEDAIRKLKTTKHLDLT